jgi:gliding motility-associated-like protein
LDLTITASSTNTTTASACDSYVWNGTSYTASGVYTGTTANCITESLDLTITASSTNTTTASACDSYVWNGTSYTASGVYTGTTANCVTEALNLTINPSPLASFNPSINLFTESPQSVAFSNTSVGAATYSWDFGDGSYSIEENPEHIFVENTNGQTITLVTESSNGCTGEYQISIEFDEVLIYYIPNTFTPDGDGYNQTFKPVFTSGFDPYHYEMLIYNLWGEIIFETHDVSYGWDGTYAFENSICQYGIYTYKITFKNPILDERKVVCGSVNLLK